MDTLREEDPARIAARRLMALHDELPSSFTVAELAQRAERMTSTSKGDGFGATYELLYPELRELLIQQAGNFKGNIDTKKLGRWLTSILRQIHEGFRLVLVRESKGHGNRYAIEPSMPSAGAQQPTSKADLPEIVGDDVEREVQFEVWCKISDAMKDFNKRFTLGDLRRQRPGLADQLDKAEIDYWTTKGDEKRQAGEQLAETWREIVTALDEAVFNRGGGPKG
jgi:hypothetical protein